MRDCGRKLRDEDVRCIVKDVVDHGQKAWYVAGLYGVSTRRVEQLAKEYRDTGKIPLLKKRGRKSSQGCPDHTKDQIFRVYKKYRLSAAPLGIILRTRHGIRMDNNRINDIMKKHGLSKDEPKKRVRKKAWIRYERRHSLTAVHMDWYYNPHLDLWVCAVLDDASRRLLSMIEAPSATTKDSLSILDDAYTRYLWLKPIESVIVDHGSQFYANTRDKKGNAEHRFERYCKDREIKQILCRYNHPQTNGKIERFFGTYQQHRLAFDGPEEFLHWYNSVRPHMSLDFDNLETPEKAFYRKAQDLILGNFMRLMEEEMEVKKDGRR